MIASIHGILLDKSSNNILIDCNGVGYEVTIPLTTFQKLPEIGSKIFLFTYLRILEDNHSLYGFANACEKNIFQELIKLNKVGPRIAIAVLGMYDYQELINIIQNNNTKALSSVPGIGKTTAERMIVELSSKINNLVEMANIGKVQMRNINNAYQKLINTVPTNPALTPTTPTNYQNQQTSSNQLTDDPTISSEINTTSPSSFIDSLNDDFDLEPINDPDYNIKQLALNALINLGLKDTEADTIIKKVYEPNMPIEQIIKLALNFYKGKNPKTK